MKNETVEIKLSIDEMESRLSKFGYYLYKLKNGKHCIADPSDGVEGYYLELIDRDVLVKDAYDHLLADLVESSDYPENVLIDLGNGFKITDEDDGFQRVKKLSDTIFHYRCDQEGYTDDEIIDIDVINKEEAISGYYDSIEAVYSEYGDSANLIIAECEFEHRCLGG